MVLTYFPLLLCWWLVLHSHVLASPVLQCSTVLQWVALTPWLLVKNNSYFLRHTDSTLHSPRPCFHVQAPKIWLGSQTTHNSMRCGVLFLKRTLLRWLGPASSPGFPSSSLTGCHAVTWLLGALVAEALGTPALNVLACTWEGWDTQGQPLTFRIARWDFRGFLKEGTVFPNQYFWWWHR